MSEELKKSVLGLLKNSKILEIEDEPTINEYKELKIDEYDTEVRHVKVFHELLDSLDQLMMQEGAGSGNYEEAKEKILNNERAIFLTRDGEPDDKELLENLKQVQQIRRLVIDSATMTLPILRSVHQVEGLTSKEAGIAEKLEKRDELSSDIIRLEKEVSKKQQELTELSLRNADNIRKSKKLTSKLLARLAKDDNNIDDEKLLKSLRKKIETAKEKSFNTAEEINAFIVEKGLNWAQDDFLRDLVLYCGEIYS